MSNNKKRRAELKRKHEEQKAIRNQKAANLRKTAKQIDAILATMKWRPDLIVYSRINDFSFFCESHGTVSISIGSRAFPEIRHYIMADEIKSVNREYVADILDDYFNTWLFGGRR